ncbi:hypothetical protein Sp245p_25900 (plasmid) [Azospirillum baldaniorum]|uniref:Uncharacterized protein n=1 Tax=Azospirillum baldaniorum TaxID=1064539 RepID=A0A9P1NRS1_9PROT|nr:hypothetical protein [Azospirillum baldaniorum]AWJ93260.1 hypothetical protein Sp245p_25900 [Azospirillum baldaniorum]TWA77954.1 hypothetical protein FBZ85_106114 [Azospirillum brasilense]CCD02946.1 protein of unknown function [Azospirillum baldaniorum]
MSRRPSSREIAQTRRAKEAHRFDHLDTRADDERCPDTLDLTEFLARIDATDAGTKPLSA